MLEVLEASARWLEARGVDAPRRSMELLLGRLLGMSRLDLYLAHDRPLSAAELDRLREQVARRGRHEPLAYLLGDWEFYGHTLEVDPAVLIPRPETEGLVERVLAVAPEGARVLDLGTGSGAIALALALERPDLKVWASDRSAEALAVATRNRARHGLEDRVTLSRGSYWEALPSDERFEVVVSNPPYVDPARPELLADDVRRFEPAQALFTPSGDPAAPYREILAGLERHLVPGGGVLLETGEGAAEAALEALRGCALLEQAQSEPDLAGIPRYLTARRVPS